jgi:hypothetical protein
VVVLSNRFFGGGDPPGSYGSRPEPLVRPDPTYKRPVEPEPAGAAPDSSPERAVTVDLGNEPLEPNTYQEWTTSELGEAIGQPNSSTITVRLTTTVEWSLLASLADTVAAFTRGKVRVEVRREAAGDQDDGWIPLN